MGQLRDHVDSGDHHIGHLRLWFCSLPPPHFTYEKAALFGVQETVGPYARCIFAYWPCVGPDFLRHDQPLPE